MYMNVERLKVLHLEFTSLCNARCPMCARTDNDNLDIASLTLADVKNMFPSKFVSRLEHMYSCGNYGDPVVNPDCIDICKYFIDNGCTSVRLFSNGGVRNTDFWKQLGKLGVSVVFAIDGLEDTNHIYRVGVDWNNLMNNVKAFISAGGSARWAYLLFEHNEHQVDEARALAKELGFESFTEKASSRFVRAVNPTIEKSNVISKTGNKINKSKVSEKYKKSAEKISADYGSWNNYIKETKITCKTQTDRSIYVDFAGNVWPCCWMGGDAYDFRSDTVNKMKAYSPKMNSLKHNTIYEILENDFFSEKLTESWNSQSDRFKICAKNCGKLYSPVHFETSSDRK